ncbi:MAG: DUF1549 domain-containing protein [Gemmataceae bacterium]
MPRPHRLAGPALLLAAAFSLAQDKSVKPGINDHFKNPDLKKFKETFEGESREIFTARKDILKACRLKPGLAVADVGAGTGLFTRLFAAEVGPKGKVYAVDIAQKFLDHVKKTSAELKFTNVETVKCTQTSCGLPPASVDVVFICDTYHHFEFPYRTMATIHQALRPGGRLVVVDFHRIPGKSREWTLGHVRAPLEVVTKEIVESGFKKTGEVKIDGLKENYLVTFEMVEKEKKESGKLDFIRDVRPVLADACFACHGFDKSKRKAGLRLDTDEGRAVVEPGRPDESELIRRLVSADARKRMPPAKFARPLDPRQIETLRRWVAEGANWAPHWAYVAPKSPPLPAVQHPAWPRNPVDQFVLARLEREGLTPSPEAPRHTLIRRLSLDLTGLPPTPDEVDAFLADSRPDAYERLVDRLLASPRFGERLAYDWLDAARYADSNGYQSDRDRVMWPWRDWVVRAFNADQPFDQFTVEQLAGDLLPGATREQVLATGLHRNHPLNGEGGRVAEESRVDYVHDRVDTTATVWMGLTLGCSRCHDHKFDPFTARDYYRLAAFFNSIDESGAVDRGGNANPVMEFPTPQQEARRQVLVQEIQDLEERRLIGPDKAQRTINKEVKIKRDMLAALERGMPTVMVMRDRPTPRPTHVLVRGAWDRPGEKVSPGVITSLAPPANERPNRLALARWLVEERHPLTARVVVNRYWQMLFGVGLVKTAEDFGVQGESSSHPELLDWLAVEFRTSGWDVKHLMKLMVTSATYRQSSRVPPGLAERDPDNRLLARGPRFRLASQIIRDQALALSGLLVGQVGGPPVKPYQPPGLWEEFSFGYIRYKQDRGTSLHRRSLYTFWRRTVGPTNLFDASMRQVCEVRPTRTNTPLHALVTLNDVTFAEAARVLAGRALREGGDDRPAWAFRVVTSRPPSDPERAVLSRAYERLLRRYRDDVDSARQVIAAGESPVEASADPAELAALAGVCAMLLNLDEVLTKE